MNLRMASKPKRGLFRYSYDQIPRNSLLEFEIFSNETEQKIKTEQ